MKKTFSYTKNLFFYNFFEKKLFMFLFRSNFIYSPYYAKNFLKKKIFLLNNKLITFKNIFIQNQDHLRSKKNFFYYFFFNFIHILFKHSLKSFYNKIRLVKLKYLEFNYKIFESIWCYTPVKKEISLRTFPKVKFFI
jgi:hypothetical protein